MRGFPAMIRILDKATAEAGFAPAQRDYGVVFTSRIRTTHWLMNVREWSANSAMAREILKVVDNSSVVINLIGMEGGFQCFDNTATNYTTTRPEPTIYIDVTGQLSVYVRGPHEEHLKRAMVRNPNMRSFDNRMATLHELGHAKQFIERPEWYALYADASKRSAFRMAIEDGAARRWKPKQPKPISVASSSSAPPPPPPPMNPGTGGPNLGFLAKPTDRPAAQPWFVVLDVDNISRHEWPMCAQLGLPQRLSYTDLGV